MEVNNAAVTQDGDAIRPSTAEAPSPVPKQKSLEGNVKRKRRRGKSKRKVMKPFSKIPWQERRRNEKSKRFRSMVLSKTHAPFNNNQFLMEIHKPEPENNFQILQTPSARTRDSSFSVDSEENYFYSLPEDEEEFLTKEFSSVYEDAQSERLSNMSKNELIQEYLLLEAKYDGLAKKTERTRFKPIEDDRESTGSEKETSVADSMCTEKDTSGTSVEITVEEPTIHEVLARLKEQEEQIHDLKIANEKLKVENECLRKKSQCESSEDSESDSSSTSISCSSSSSSRASPIDVAVDMNEVPNSNGINGIHNNGVNGENGVDEVLVNGHHENNLSPSQTNGEI